jgi:NADH-quinone oxidoreductase subunit N
MFNVDMSLYYIITYLIVYNISLALLFSILLHSTVDLKFNNLINKLNNKALFKFYFTISILSIAGIPPLFGFFLKLTLIYYISISSYMVIILLGTFLLISLYFYIQNLRYLMWLEDESVKTNNLYIKLIPTKLINITNFSSTFLILGLFFYDDIILLIYWILL